MPELCFLISERRSNAGSVPNARREEEEGDGDSRKAARIAGDAHQR